MMGMTPSETILASFKEQFKFGEEYGSVDTSYRRVWTKPITTYAENYNKFDISLAPLNKILLHIVVSN